MWTFLDLTSLSSRLLVKGTMTLRTRLSITAIGLVIYVTVRMRKALAGPDPDSFCPLQLTVSLRRHSLASVLLDEKIK